MTASTPTNRPEFFNGQRLSAADLSAAQDYHRELLWLHQRTLHGWGITTGLAAAGSKGDRAVTVAPGVAVDNQGRTIVLSAPVSLPVPAVAGDPGGQPIGYLLTASYVDDPDLAAVDRDGTCGSFGAVRRPEHPLIRWQQQSDTNPESIFRSGLDIVLGSITVLNCRLTAAVSGTGRRSALPDHQPYVYAGESIRPDWNVWRADPTNTDSVVLGLVASVDTSEAGFANAPLYQAHVVGSRTYLAPTPGAEISALIDGFADVVDATAAGFDLRVTLPPLGQRWNPPELILATTAQRLGWSVVWLGVER